MFQEMSYDTLNREYHKTKKQLDEARYVIYKLMHNFHDTDEETEIYKRANVFVKEYKEMMNK